MVPQFKRHEEQGLIWLVCFIELLLPRGDAGWSASAGFRLPVGWVIHSSPHWEEYQIFDPIFSPNLDLADFECRTSVQPPFLLDWLVGCTQLLLPIVDAGWTASTDSYERALGLATPDMFLAGVGPFAHFLCLGFTIWRRRGCRTSVVWISHANAPPKLDSLLTYRGRDQRPLFASSDVRPRPANPYVNFVDNAPVSFGDLASLFLLDPINFIFFYVLRSLHTLLNIYTSPFLPFLPFSKLSVV